MIRTLIAALIVAMITVPAAAGNIGIGVRPSEFSIDGSPVPPIITAEEHVQRTRDKAAKFVAEANAAKAALDTVAGPAEEATMAFIRLRAGCEAIAEIGRRLPGGVTAPDCANGADSLLTKVRSEKEAWAAKKEAALYHWNSSKGEATRALVAYQEAIERRNALIANAATASLEARITELEAQAAKLSRRALPPTPQPRPSGLQGPRTD